jgi:flagellar basal-body rod modification protein FlgD
VNKLTGGGSALGQDAFLTLMLTQLKNQDPFKPQDPSAFIGQLAQFSTVTGIQGMQQNISTLSDSLRSSQVLDGTMLVGHTVRAVNDTATLSEAGIIGGAVTIPQGVSQAGIAITDASGQLVKTLPLSSQEGPTTFSWDGTTNLGERAPAGNYSFVAVANVAGVNTQLETQMNSRVGSVTIDPSNYSLTLNTDLGPIPLANVRSVM